MNYIINAIKYGGKPPTITFGAEQLSDGFVRYWITDPGRGFSREEHFGGQLILRFVLQEILLFLSSCPISPQNWYVPILHRVFPSTRAIRV